MLIYMQGNEMILKTYNLTWIFDWNISLFREDKEPIIENSNCKNCPICSARTGNLDDICKDINIDGDTFFAMVVTHEPHQNGTVTFSGLNLKNVTLLTR